MSVFLFTLCYITKLYIFPLLNAGLWLCNSPVYNYIYDVQTPQKKLVPLHEDNSLDTALPQAAVQTDPVPEVPRRLLPLLEYRVPLQYRSGEQNQLHRRQHSPRQPCGVMLYRKRPRDQPHRQHSQAEGHQSCPVRKHSSRHLVVLAGHFDHPAHGQPQHACSLPNAQVHSRPLPTDRRAQKSKSQPVGSLAPALQPVPRRQRR
jgi:hypothetical protein